MRILINIPIIILLCGCARLHPAAVPDLRVDNSLWNLQIIYHDRTMFSGLLLLKEQKNHLKTAVLDSSGITILNGRLTEQGEMEVTYCLAPAREHDLVGFLGPALDYIFYQAPTQDCFHEDRAVVCRSGLSSLFLWSARYLNNNDKEIAIHMRNPGADLVLHRIEQKTK